MLYLIEYDRSAGRIATFRAFADDLRVQAEDARLALELKLNGQSIEREIVLLEASDEDALRRTHRRYFEDLASLAATTSGSITPGPAKDRE